MRSPVAPNAAKMVGMFPCSATAITNRLYSLFQKPFFERELGVEDAAACGAADDVVRKRDKFEIENTVLAQTADSDRHAFVGIPIFFGLRPVGLVAIMDGLLRSKWKIELLRLPFEILPNFENFFARWFVLSEKHVHTREMAIGNGNAVAVRRN